MAYVATIKTNDGMTCTGTTVGYTDSGKLQITAGLSITNPSGMSPQYNQTASTMDIPIGRVVSISVT